MKTRKQAEQRALELYPDIKVSTKLRYTINDVKKIRRQAYLQCFDDMQKAKQREALIELTQMGDYGSTSQDTKLHEDKIDLISLSNKHLDKMNKEFNETGKVPNWWKGVSTISITAIEEFENTFQDTKLREAAEKVVQYWKMNPSLVDDWERDMDIYVEELQKELK